MMKTLLRPIPLIILAAVAGCGLLPQTEQVRMYRLPLQAPAPSVEAPRFDVSLRIRTPRASGVLSTARIAVVPAGNEIRSYRGARWSEPAPGLLRDHLVEILQRDGRFAYVHDEENRLPADIEMVSSLRAFQGEYENGDAFVHVRLDVRLVEASGRRMLAGRRFEAVQPSDSENVEKVVQAFGQAASELGEQVAEWTAMTFAACEWGNGVCGRVGQDQASSRSRSQLSEPSRD